MRNFLEFIPQTDDIDLSRIDRFQKKNVKPCCKYL